MISALRRTGLLPAFLLLFWPLVPCQAREKTKDAGKDIDKAVERGVNYVKGKQNKDGSWSGQGYETGVTALAVYALLKANCHLADPAVSSGLGVLLSSSISSNAPRATTYEVSLIAVALATAIEKAEEMKINPAANIEPAAFRQKLQEAAEWLVTAQHDCRADNRSGRARRAAKQPAARSRSGCDLGPYYAKDAAAWGYCMVDYNYVDNSNTQFALLGLRAAQNIHDYHSGTNIAIPREVWEQTLARLVSGQSAAGEWDYGPPVQEQNAFQTTMTAAGIGGMIICLSSLIEKPDIEMITRTPEIAKALGRLERIMYPPPNTVRIGAMGIRQTPDRSGYMLYSLERACMLGGLSKLGAHDWYAEGAADLLHMQLSDGSWAGGWYNAQDTRHKAPQFRDNTIETSFALLFLTRGCIYTPAQSPYKASTP